jgi:hypothetical protein
MARKNSVVVLMTNERGCCDQSLAQNEEAKDEGGSAEIEAMNDELKAGI